MLVNFDAALARWPEWGLALSSPPQPLRRLTGGSTNQNMLIDAAGERLVLRLGNPLAASLGVNREAEISALKAAGSVGLAPRLHWHDDDGQTMVVDYVEGHELAAQDLSRARQTQLLDGLSRMHDLNVSLPKRDYAAYYLNFCKRAGVAESLPMSVVAHLEALESADQACLVHHDPIPGNVLFHHAGVSFIDWEYAAGGLLLFDYVTLVDNWHLAIDDVAAAADLPADQLQHACMLYREFCGWWDVVYASTVKAALPRV